MNRFLLVLLLVLSIVFAFTACDKNIQIETIARPSQSPQIFPTNTKSLITPEPDITTPPTETPSPTPTPTPWPDEAKNYHAIFTKEGYIYQFKNLTISKFVKKEYRRVSVSPDKSLIVAFDTFLTSSKAYMDIYDLKGNKLKYVELENQQVEIIEWKDSDTIYVSMHINPWVTANLIYNMNDNSSITFYGSNVIFIPNTDHFVYIENEPRGPLKTVIINEKIIYEAAEDVNISNLSINSSGTEIVILLTDTTSSKKIIRVYDYDSKKIELNQTYELILEDSYSSIYYNDQDKISIYKADYIYELDKTNNKLNQVGPYIEPETSPEMKLRNDILNDAIRNEFGNNNYDTYYNVSWLS